MKTVKVDFTSRFKLVALLSEQSGPLGKTAPFMRILEKVRFSDDEDKAIIRKKVSETQLSFVAPSDDFGKKDIHIEDSDAHALLSLLESWEHFRTTDHEWTSSLIRDLHPFRT